VETGLQFEAREATAMSHFFEMELRPAAVPVSGDVVKRFGLVSGDQSIVGDAKRYTTLRTPARTWANFAEYVWLLQKLDPATRTFLAFGGDAEVPQRWLDRYRSIAAPFLLHLSAGKPCRSCSEPAQASVFHCLRQDGGAWPAAR
jgi:hypothetical protein